MKEPLASPQDLADHLGVPVKTTYEWTYRGTGPKAIKVGRHVRYRWSDIETWLRLQEKERSDE